MPKKRKTRKEKILKDQKKTAVHEVVPIAVSSTKNEAQPIPQNQTKQEQAATATFSLPQVHTTPVNERPSAQPITVAADDYSYLATDLMKTALLTGAIVFAELLIRLFFVH